MTGIVRVSRGDAIGLTLSGLAALGFGVFYLTPARMAEISAQVRHSQEKLFPWLRGRGPSPRTERLLTGLFRAGWIAIALLAVVGWVIELLAGPN